MKRTLTAMALVGALGLAGCGYSTGDRAVTGGALGAADELEPEHRFPIEETMSGGGSAGTGQEAQALVEPHRVPGDFTARRELADLNSITHSLAQ